MLESMDLPIGGIVDDGDLGVSHFGRDQGWLVVLSMVGTRVQSLGWSYHSDQLLLSFLYTCKHHLCLTQRHQSRYDVISRFGTQVRRPWMSG